MLVDFRLDHKNRDVIHHIAGAISSHGGRALIVGGWVRDNCNPKAPIPADVDLEIYGMHMQTISGILDSMGIGWKVCGEKFAAIKLKDYNVDITIPRKENRIGPKHTDFELTFHPDMSPEEAALRRDFTVNSMYYDPMTKELGDPFNGIADLQSGMLRITNAKKFSEDPLRVLRAMQFIARFGFTPDVALIKQSQDLVPQFKTLSKERVFEEWKKLILKGKHFEKALDFLCDTLWIINFPELEGLNCLEQDHEWHPEGDAYTHISHCMNAFGKLNIIGPNYGTIHEDFDRLVVGFGVLLHDVGKPDTTEVCKDGRIRSLRHDKVGVPLAEVFMRRITDWEDLIEAVLPMVGEHMFTASFNSQQMTRRGIRRLARRCYSIDLLCYVIQCDKEGRPPLAADLSDIVDLRTKAQEYDVYNEPPVPIMMGRHLIEMGLKPGTMFGMILTECQDAEDEGVITDVENGKHFVTNLLSDPDIDCSGDNSK